MLLDLRFKNFWLTNIQMKLTIWMYFYVLKIIHEIQYLWVICPVWDSF